MNNVPEDAIEFDSFGVTLTDAVGSHRGGGMTFGGVLTIGENNWRDAHLIMNCKQLDHLIKFLQGVLERAK